MHSCITFVLGARPAMRAAAALPALFSSMKLMVELIMRRTTTPVKSCQSGGFPYCCAWIVKKIKKHHLHDKQILEIK